MKPPCPVDRYFRGDNPFCLLAAFGLAAALLAVALIEEIFYPYMIYE